MSITLYHGTTCEIVKNLANCQIDVDLGGGEFGKGFYLGDSKRLAKRRAFHKIDENYGNARDAMRYKNNTLAVTFELDDLLRFYRGEELTREEGKKLFVTLSKKPRQTNSYSFSANYSIDYIVGPVVGRKGRYYCVTQYKFDSKKSETVLNKQCQHVQIKTSII